MFKKSVLILFVFQLLFPVFSIAKKTNEHNQVKELVKLNLKIKPTFWDIKIIENWAFVDVADSQTSWTVLLKNTNSQWEILSQKDPEEWTEYTKQMSPKVKKAFEVWHSGHID